MTLALDRRAALGAFLAVASACGRLDFGRVAVTDAEEADGIPISIAPVEFGAGSVVRDVALTPDGDIAIVGDVSAGGHDVLVAVLAPDLTVRWIKTFGSAGVDEGYGVAVDADGTVIIVGRMTGSVSFGGATLTAINDDGFVAAFAADGTHQWSRLVGGAAMNASFGSDAARRVAIGPDGNPVIGGSVRGIVDFGGGFTTPASAAQFDGFVAGLTKGSGDTRWVYRFGITGYNNILSLSVDENNAVFAGGFYEGAPDFGSGAAIVHGLQDAVVLAFDAAGTYRWSTSFGANNYDWVTGLRARAGSVLAGGHYAGTLDVLGIPSARGARDGFLASFAASTGAVEWAVAVGGTGCDAIMGIDMTVDGEPMMTGFFEGSIQLDVTQTSLGAHDIFVAGIGAAGDPTWSTTYGSATDDVGWAAAGSRTGGLFSVGATDNPLAADCHAPTANGVGFVRRD